MTEAAIDAGTPAQEKPWPGLSFMETLAHIKSDYVSWVDLYKFEHTPRNYVSFFLLPGSFAVLLYRISSYFYYKRWRILSRLIYMLNVFLTGSEMVPEARIGKGFILLHSVGTIIMGHIGDNVVVSGMTGIGSDGRAKDCGAGPGIPVIEDDVKIGVRCLIIGGVRIGRGAAIAANSMVNSDVAPGTMVRGSPAKFVREIQPGFNLFRQDRP